MSNVPLICRRCHKGGHHTSQCREAASRSATSRGDRGSHPAPCWTCELIPGAESDHWGAECPVEAQRLKDRQCTLCGSPDYWKMGCDKYIKDKHTAKRLVTTYLPTGPKRAAIPWCLRRGKKRDHPTMDHKSTYLPILLPSAADASDLSDVCFWCSIKGHSQTECMRRASVQANENASAIMGLSQCVDVV